MVDTSQRSDLLHALHSAADAAYVRLGRCFYPAGVVEFLLMATRSPLALVGFVLLVLCMVILVRARIRVRRASFTVEQLYRREDRRERPWGAT